MHSLPLSTDVTSWQYGLGQSVRAKPCVLKVACAPEFCPAEHLSRCPSRSRHPRDVELLASVIIITARRQYRNLPLPGEWSRRRGRRHLLPVRHVQLHFEIWDRIQSRSMGRGLVCTLSTT